MSPAIRARILEPTPEHIEAAALTLRQGEIVAMPTETVYGLAGNAFDPAALTKIFNTKERPTFDPLIVHVAAPSMSSASSAQSPLGHLKTIEYLSAIEVIDLERLSDTAKSRAESLLQAFWPGPFTLVLPKHRKIPELATSGLPTVAVRMPRHPVAQALLRCAGFPLAAPSANRFGRISPTSPQHVLEELGDRIGMILDGGPCEVGVESTILSISSAGELTLLRPGGISVSEIRRVCGAEPLVASARDMEEGKKPLAPGMLDSHYAPRKPMCLLPASVDSLEQDQIAELRPWMRDRIGLLVFGDPEAKATRLEELTGRIILARSFSVTKDLDESARNLFTTLRRMDESDVEVIFCEPSPSREGLGHAIEDRLTRASSK